MRSLPKAVAAKRSTRSRCCAAASGRIRYARQPVTSQPRRAAVPGPVPFALDRHVKLAATGAGPEESSPPAEQQSVSWEKKLASLSEQLCCMFPIWMLLTAVLAFSCPQLFTWFGPQYTTYALALTMLGMGFTLTIDEFVGIFKNRPYLLLLGLGLQYTILPSLGLLYSKLAHLSAPLATGLILVSCCPGGTASNIVAYVARGDMALSIMMTTASTLAAIVATPLLTAKLVGTLVPVDAAALCVSTVQVVLAPVLLGAWANSAQPKLTRRVAQFSPLAATLLVCLIVGSTLAHNTAALAATGATLVLCVAALHGSGFALGYALSRLLRLSEAICRTNSIEVGMQNSTLGAVLAALHFADPLVAAPCALSACTHAIMGSLLAAYWRAQDDKRGLAEAAAA